MKKPSKKKEELKAAIKKKPSIDTQKGEEKSFDFGGMPNRDLKKNLGC